MIRVFVYIYRNRILRIIIGHIYFKSLKTPIVFYKTKNKILEKYIEGFYFISSSNQKKPLKFLSFPGNYFLASICENGDVTFSKNQINIVRSSDSKITTDFYFKSSVPIRVNYFNQLNEITIYFKPLGIFYFLETQEDLNQLINGNSLSLPNYLKVMKKVLQLESDPAKIDAIENYWASLLKVKNLTLIEGIVKDVENNMGISTIAEKHNISRQYMHKLFVQFTGKSPTAYRKIHKFKRMILQYKDNQHLTSLVYDNAYFDQAHFNKHFKELTNLSPKLFIKNAIIRDSILWIQ